MHNKAPKADGFAVTWIGRLVFTSDIYLPLSSIAAIKNDSTHQLGKPGAEITIHGFEISILVPGKIADFFRRQHRHNEDTPGCLSTWMLRATGFCGS